MGGEWFLKAQAGGGCAAAVNDRCYGRATRYNKDDWRELPRDFQKPKNKSGAACRRCIAHLLREAAAAAPKRPASNRPRNSPYAQRLSLKASSKRAKPRSEVDVLIGDSYQLGPGRQSEPINWDGRKRPRDEGATASDPLTGCPAPPASVRRPTPEPVVLPAPAPAAPAPVPASLTSTPSLLPLRRGINVGDNMDKGDMKDVLRKYRELEKELRAEVASLKKKVEARKDYDAVVAELKGLQKAMAKACATSANARRAEASRRLIAEGLEDFPALFDEAICEGVLRINKGSKRCQAAFFSDAARHMNQSNSNLWRFSVENEQLWAATGLLKSGKSAVALLRGPQGLGSGSTAPIVDAKLPVNFFGVPSPQKNRHTVKTISPDKDEETGFFPSAIASVLAIGGHDAFIKVDATDLRPDLSVDTEFSCQGDVAIHAFDPKATDPSETSSRLTALCGPARALFPGRSLEGDGEGESSRTPDRPLEREFLSSVAESRLYCAERQRRLAERIGELLKKRAKKEQKYAKKRGRGKQSLHFQQLYQLMMITKEHADASALAADVEKYVAAATALIGTRAPTASSSDRNFTDWYRQLCEVARLQIDVIPRLSELEREAATHLYAVFLHACDHSTFSCIGRFYSKLLTKPQARLLYEKAKETIMAVKRGEEAPAPIIRGLVGDGEFACFADHDEVDGVANLSQAAKRARKSIGEIKLKFHRVFPYRKSVGRDGRILQRDTLIGVWMRSVFERGGPPLRAPELLGFGPAKDAAARDAALKAYAAQRRRLGSSTSKATRDFVKDIMKEKTLATAAAVFRDVSLAPRMPAEERILLDALLCYLPTSRKLTAIEELAGPGYSLDEGRDLLVQKAAEYNVQNYEPCDEDVRICAAILHACRNADMKKLLEALEAAVVQAEMDKILTQHKGLRSRYYNPNLAADPSSFYHECFNHKLKSIIYGLAGGDGALVSLSHMLAAARVQPNRIVAEAICSGAIDKHADLPARAMVADEATKLRLLDRGLIRECLFLDVLSEFHESFEMPGLDADERAIRRAHFRFMAFALFGPQLFDTTPNMANQEFKERTGLVSNGILAALANGDGVDVFLEHATPELRRVFVEKALSNVPDLENYFSLLVGRIGYKPTVPVAEAALKSVDALSILKSSASRSFYMCQSKKKKYDSTEASTKAYAHWNDGERLLKTSEKYQEYVKDLVARAENLVRPRTATVREKTKLKAA